MPHVRIRYFAGLREALGSGETMAIEPGATVAWLLDALRARGGRHAEALAEGRAVRCAVNQAMAAADAPLGDGAEVAFFPPVTGG
jgi:sulfur-carrier protein